MLLGMDFLSKYRAKLDLENVSMIAFTLWFWISTPILIIFAVPK
jgi:hypothetical protein